MNRAATVKNPNWTGAIQLAIYKCSRDVEPGTTAGIIQQVVRSRFEPLDRIDSQILCSRVITRSVSMTDLAKCRVFLNSLSFGFRFLPCFLVILFMFYFSPFFCSHFEITGDSFPNCTFFGAKSHHFVNQ